MAAAASNNLLIRRLTLEVNFDVIIQYERNIPVGRLSDILKVFGPHQRAAQLEES
jgi:hypothetical protein